MFLLRDEERCVSSSRDGEEISKEIRSGEMSERIINDNIYGHG